MIPMDRLCIWARLSIHGHTVGTYSSIFVATPIVVDLTQAEANRRLKAEDQIARKQKKTKKTAKA